MAGQLPDLARSVERCDGDLFEATKPPNCILNFIWPNHIPPDLDLVIGSANRMDDTVCVKIALIPLNRQQFDKW